MKSTLIAALLILLLSCHHFNPYNGPSLNVQTFDSTMKGYKGYVDGRGGRFSLTEKEFVRGNYLLTTKENKDGAIVYLRIDSNFIELPDTGAVIMSAANHHEFIANYANKDYYLTLDLTEVSGVLFKTHTFAGTMLLKAKSGESITKHIFGRIDE